MLDVLDWVKKRIDAPVAPQKGAPARTAGPSDLRGANPTHELLELGARIETADGDPNARSAALALIQDSSAAPVTALLMQYLVNATGAHAAREAAWKSLIGFQLHLAQALCASAGAQLTAVSAVRALSACRVLAKLHLMHYAAVPGRLWHVAYRLHAGAEKAGFAATPVHAQSDQRATTTVEREFLRVLMLQVSAPDMLAPAEIEVADRILERLGAELTLRELGVCDNPFCFEPASEYAPRRVKDRQPAATTRYFGPGLGSDSLERIGGQPAAAKLEEFTPFGEDIGPTVQLNTVRHLLIFWRVDCPYTPPAHEPASGAVRVVHGLGAAWQDVAGAQQNGGELSLAATSPGVAQPSETWQLRGAGGGELAAEVPQESRSWVKCGGLVSLALEDRPEHWVGIVRRMHAEPDGGLQADIAVLSCAPRAHTLRESGDRVYAEAASKEFGINAVRGLILADGAEPGQPANFVLPSEGWKEGRVLELEHNGELRYLRGVRALRRGDDYVRATFEWVEAPG